MGKLNQYLSASQNGHENGAIAAALWREGGGRPADRAAKQVSWRAGARWRIEILFESTVS